MRGSVYKRCQCPSRTDSRGRRLTCTKEHGSWSYRVDLTGRAGAANRRGQVVRGGFPTKAAAEQALAEALTASQAGQLVPDRRLRLAGGCGLGPVVLLIIGCWRMESDVRDGGGAGGALAGPAGTVRGSGRLMSRRAPSGAALG